MKVLGICGSLRKDSWNLKLLKVMMEKTAERGVETEIFDLSVVPLYHPDVEALAIPGGAEQLRETVRVADAVVIACPEYNSSMSSALKNAIEWLARQGSLLTGRVFYIMGTSPGRSGCMKMHLQASYSLESEGGLVLHHPRVLLPNVASLMDESGRITDPEVSSLLKQAAERVVWYTGHMAGGS